MNKQTLLIAGGGLLLGLVCVVVGSIKPGQLIPSPPNHGGPDLLARFATGDNKAEAKQDALKFASICGSVAKALEHEFSDGADPVLMTGTQLATMRNKIRHSVMDKERLAAKYSGFAEVVEKFIDEAAGKNGGPFKDGEKEKWIEAFRKLSAASEYAAGRL